MLAFAPIDGAAGAAYHVVTALADLIAPLAGATATAAAIVLFTVLVRVVISPLSWAQIRGQQRQAALAPKLRELQQRHASDPAMLRTEMTALYREAGTTPLSGCLLALLQAPFFFVVYRLFTTSTVNGQSNGLLDERLLGVPLGQHFADGPSMVFFVLLAALAALAWFTSQRMRRSMAAVTPAALNRVLPLLPYTVLIAAAVMPLAAGLYPVTTTAWTALEQGFLRRRYPVQRMRSVADAQHADFQADGALALARPPWTADYLIRALTQRPSTLFPELERIAREKGYGDMLDAWNDLDLCADDPADASSPCPSGSIQSLPSECLDEAAIAAGRQEKGRR